MPDSAVELATAYVSVSLSSGGLGKEVQKAFGDNSITGAVEKAGKHSGHGFTHAIGGVLKKGAIGVGVAAGGVLATSLFKGWGRLTQIENAKAKLDGLGHSAGEVKQIMGNALASVEGTAFGLDEAATVAASVVAAGIKPGKDLQRTLTLVADSAAGAGTSMGDMGAIFAKVATSNKVQGDVLAQLGDKGIPIVEMLGKTMGKTSDQIYSMSKKGTISFKDFQKAMEVQLGGSALKIGATTAGSFKNMGAALSRFGVSLLQGVFPIAKVVFGGITKLLNGLGKVVGPIAEKIGSFVGNIAKQLGNLFGAVKDGDSQGVGEVIDNMFGNTGKFVTPIRKLADAFGKFFGHVRSALPKVIDGFKSLVKTFGPLIKDFYKLEIGALGKAFKILGPAVDKTAGAFKAIGGWMADNKTLVQTLAVAVGGAVVAFQLWKVGVAAWSAVTKAATAVQAAFTAVMDANPVMLVVLAIAAFAAGLIYAYKHSETFRNIVQAVFHAIGTVIGAVVTAFTTAFNWIKDHWKLILGIITGPIGAAVLLIITYWDTIKAGVSAVKDWIVGRFNDVVGFIVSVPGKIGGAAIHMWDAIKTSLGKAKDWISDRVDDIVGYFTALPGRFVNGIGNIWGWIGDSFKTIINKVIGWWNDFSIHLEIPHNFVSDHIGLGGKGFTVETPNIDPLAKGGIVPATPGGRIVRVAEAGHAEAIIPIDGKHGFGGTVSLDPADRALLAALASRPVTVNVDSREIARASATGQLALARR